MALGFQFERRCAAGLTAVFIKKISFEQEPPMTRVHSEFAYQSRELEGQIDGILGDPPNRKNYKMMVDALVSEYANGGGIEDVNMMSFALVDRISFTDPKGLLKAAAEYESDDPSAVFGMAKCDAEGEAM